MVTQLRAMSLSTSSAELCVDEGLGSFKVAIIDPIIGSIIFTIKLFLEPIFD